MDHTACARHLEQTKQYKPAVIEPPGKKEDKDMREYYIYNIATDEYIGTVEANTISGAERKAAGTIAKEIDSEYIAAYSEKF